MEEESAMADPDTLLGHCQPQPFANDHIRGSQAGDAAADHATDYSTTDTIWIEVGHGRAARIDSCDEELVRAHRWGSFRAGRTCYAWSTIDKRTVHMHRLIAGAPPGQDVDHKNRDGLDNRRRNLRCKPHADNLANQGLSRANSSGYAGVYWDSVGQGWTARMRTKGKMVSMGTYDVAFVAAQARDLYAEATYGECARLNVLQPGDERAVIQAQVDAARRTRSKAARRRHASPGVRYATCEPAARKPSEVGAWLERCAATLRDTTGARARAWLNDQGITEAVARKLGIGLNDTACQLAVEGEEAVTIPRGIVVPAGDQAGDDVRDVWLIPSTHDPVPRAVLGYPGAFRLLGARSRFLLLCASVQQAVRIWDAGNGRVDVLVSDDPPPGLVTGYAVVVPSAGYGKSWILSARGQQTRLTNVDLACLSAAITELGQ
jgi:hypothetical protein